MSRTFVGNVATKLAVQMCMPMGTTNILRNASISQLYVNALCHEKPRACKTNTGALSVTSGEKTGRSPLDKRVMRDDKSQQNVWWASEKSCSPNFEMDENAFLNARALSIDYLQSLDKIYVVDGYANWDKSKQVKVRVVTEYAYHALFMHNMLIRPTAKELATFGTPDFTIYNAGNLKANVASPFMTSETSVCISLKHNEMVILGTKYAGEMKKGIFSFIHYKMPQQNVLSLHSGCNVGKRGDVTLFFGLSGTGKTTLSADLDRHLIGDDEHCWGDDGVFNIEGGCYAKCIGLKQENEPEIFNAIKHGAVLENVIVDRDTGVPDYDSSAITENTRVCYPIEHIPNAQIPCIAGHPTNIVMLCCDAYGVLPPVSKLTTEQAMYHFVNGYTSKVAGTEVGVTEPQSTFSACYGGAFLMWHPLKYASMLAEKIVKHGTRVWLVNTGWIGGGVGQGKRISLAHTRSIINAIHNNSLVEFEEPSKVFHLRVPASCPGVPTEILNPEKAWCNRAAFEQSLQKLGVMFAENHSLYMSDVDGYDAHIVRMINSGGPTCL